MGQLEDALQSVVSVLRWDKGGVSDQGNIRGERGENGDGH